MSQQIVNYMYEIDKEILKPAEKFLKLIEESKENQEVAKFLSPYEETRKKTIELLSKYNGNPSVYKPDEIAQLIGLKLQIDQDYESLKKVAIKGLPTEKANEAGKEVYEKVMKTRKSLEKALKQILPERGNEVLRFYKNQADGVYQTYKNLEKVIADYSKK